MRIVVNENTPWKGGVWRAGPGTIRCLWGGSPSVLTSLTTCSFERGRHLQY